MVEITMSSIYLKITKHSEKQDNITNNAEKIITTDPEMTEVIE